MNSVNNLTAIDQKEEHCDKKKSRNIACCGPGKRRHILPGLCTLALTIVIGMRAEMLSIISYINSNSSIETLKKSGSYVFQPSAHRELPWTQPSLEDYVENAFFFANIVSSPIGGYLTVNHDPSLLLGSSVAMTCGLNLFLPLAATIGGNEAIKISVVIILRILQGLAEGCLIPAMFGVLRFWAPISERSTIVCFSVIGVSLGPLIGLPFCLAIEKRWGWGVVFYIYANLGLIWCIFWWRLIDERPSRSKTISREELEYILQGVRPALFVICGSSGSRSVKISIPWKGMLKSKAVYAILMTYAADDWTFQITSVCMQSFYNNRFESDIDRTISLLIYPFLARSIFVPIGGVVADVLGYATNLSWLNIRKMLTVLGFGLKAIFFIAMAFAPNEKTATIMLSLCLGFSGLAVAGYAVNVIEIAPNYSGLVMGIATSVSTFCAVLSVVVASLIVKYIEEYGWLIAISTAASIQIFSMVMYLLMASCEEELWATPVVVNENGTTENNESYDNCNLQNGSVEETQIL